ncbi:hypothetical protein BLOT_002625 [Blomia tropicalis]|nr:hypothetical protein BLOT_002625 [Blomia tropicalis]
MFEDRQSIKQRFAELINSKLMATTTTNTTATMIEPLLPCLESTGKPIPIEDEKEEEPMSATTSLLKYMLPSNKIFFLLTLNIKRSASK